MARIRSIKPAFFRHEDLFEAEKRTGFPLRLIFAGLWTVADREGRFEWKPRAIKLDVLPYDDIDFSSALEALAAHGFIVKYTVSGRTYAHIPSWSKHQQVNTREAQSEIPAPADASASTCMHMPDHVQDRGEQEQEQEQEQEGKGMDFDAREQVRDAPKPEPISSEANSTKANKGTRWPADAIVPEGWIPDGHATRERAGLPPLDLRAEALKFANYWAAKSGGAATKVDWKRTWMNWCLNAKGSLHAKPNGHGARSIFAEIGDELAAREAGGGTRGLAEAD